MPLTDTAIRNAKPKEKQYKIADERGLYLLVLKSGKYFRWDYRFAGKRKTMALGVYPDTSLALARKRRDEGRELLARDIDPSQLKKAKRAAMKEMAENNFESIAREWIAKQKHKWSNGHTCGVTRKLELNIFPWLGKRPIKQITAKDLLTVLGKMEKRGVPYSAGRVKAIVGQVFRYAIATDRAENDPSAALQGSLTPTITKHRATITAPKKIGGLLRAIDGYDGHIITICALKLAPLVFVRPGELRHAEWSEIDLNSAEWKIPAEKMKMKRPHIIPLSRQAVEVFKEIYPVTGHGQYVFPSIRSVERPMSNNTMNAALRRMGYTKNDMTAHGFRAMSSTVLHEQGWPTDIVERQLAHTEQNKVKSAYDHAEHLPQRRKMMQSWADYLDALKGGAKVIPLRRVSEG